MVRRFKIREGEAGLMTVSMPVDTGRVCICIKEAVQEQLQLPVVEKRKGQFANVSIVEYDVAGPIEVRFKNRRCVEDAMVLPSDNELLLEARPIEDIPARLPYLKLI